MPVRQERLVVFDCDGVLVDSEILVVGIEAELLQAAGIQITADDIVATCVGLSDAAMEQVIERRWQVRLPADFVEQRQARIADAFETSLRPVPGIPQLLDRLRAPRCVASSSEPKRVRRSLELTGLSGHFGSNLFSASMVGRGSRSPTCSCMRRPSWGYRPRAAW